MSTSMREVAKFLSGIAANETLGHWWLGIWGKHLLPMQLGWFAWTDTMNTFAMVFWPIVLVTLVWYAWVRKTGRNPLSGAGG
jgi:hypothetical protein